MSFLVKTIPAPRPRTETSWQIALLYAGVLVVMAIAQLFTFEKFLVYIQDIGLPLAFAPFLVVAEVFAVPYLLRMALSPAFRYLSMFLGLLAAVLWLYISAWLVISKDQVNPVGFLGTLVDLTPGWWAICISLAMVILAVWSTWGLWPGKRPKN